MHPAKSVIFFTTASGAGYGLICLLIAASISGTITPDMTLGLVGYAIGFGLVSAGLLSSTFHLGHPERAWRALTQWRTSWPHALSRMRAACCAAQSQPFALSGQALRGKASVGLTAEYIRRTHLRDLLRCRAASRSHDPAPRPHS